MNEGTRVLFIGLTLVAAAFLWARYDKPEPILYACVGDVVFDNNGDCYKVIR